MDPNSHSSLSKFTNTQSPASYLWSFLGLFLYCCLFSVACLVTLNINKWHQMDTRSLWRIKGIRRYSASFVETHLQLDTLWWGKCEGVWTKYIRFPKETPGQWPQLHDLVLGSCPDHPKRVHTVYEEVWKHSGIPKPCHWKQGCVCISYEFPPPNCYKLGYIKAADIHCLLDWRQGVRNQGTGKAMLPVKPLVDMSFPCFWWFVEHLGRL